MPTDTYSVGDRIHLVGIDGKHLAEVYRIDAKEWTFVDRTRYTLADIDRDVILELIPFGVCFCNDEGCRCGLAEEEPGSLSTVEIARRCGYKGDDAKEAEQFIDNQAAEGLLADAANLGLP